MRVLVLARSYPWPLTSGGNLRTRALIQALSRRHAVVFSAPLEPSLRDEVEAHSHGLVSRFVWVDPAGARWLPYPAGGGRLGRLAAYVKDCLATGDPLFYRRAGREWGEAVGRELPGVDAVLCRSSSLATLLPRSRLRQTVVDEDDLPFRVKWREARTGVHGLGSLLVALEAARTYGAVRRIARQVARMLTASVEDARRLAGPRITVVPNGIDLEPGPTNRVRCPEQVVFVGSCGYDPNRLGLDWFLRLVWPRVLERHPGARFAIVGSHADLEQIPRATATGVSLHNRVPSIRPWFESSAVSVVPLFLAGGTRIKILESLAYGTPVVSTPIGAEGLSESFGREEGVLLAATIPAMVDELCRILGGDDAPARAAAKGRAVVEERFTWGATTRELTEQFEAWVTPG